MIFLYFIYCGFFLGGGGRGHFAQTNILVKMKDYQLQGIVHVSDLQLFINVVYSHIILLVTDDFRVNNVRLINIIHVNRDKGHEIIVLSFFFHESVYILRYECIT